jgi:hypothetical protein
VNLEESLDFDLEDLVGGPLVSASSSRFASIGRSNGSNGAGGANGYHASGASSGGFGGAGAVVKTELRNSMVSAQVKVEPNTSTATPPNGVSAAQGAAAAAAGAKKVGMKPRPKIVIA